jgi:O-methyltransferase involved in polyketide biosynthesis
MILNAEAVAAGQASQQIIIRTLFWDEALLDAQDGVSQVVILAAGRDARAYRLPWRGHDRLRSRPATGDRGQGRATGR